jgi:hypothetical protein
VGVGRVLAAGTAALVAIAVSVAMSSGTPNGCGATTVDVARVTKLGTVAGFYGDQLVNAALIMNAATSAGLPAAAQTIGVMTAIGESTLRNLDHGDESQGVTNPDGTPTCSVGLFQQQWCLSGAPWGTKADAMDPTTAASAFFTRLAGVEDWETMAPTAVIHEIQGNEGADYYAQFFDPATKVVQALAGIAPAGGCGSVSIDAQALAQELVNAADEGRLVGSVPDHIKEIRWIAEGKNVADCSIDTRILQVLVLVVREFQKVGVSDINRKCTGQIEGAGTESSHYKDGGGHAIDFYRLNGNGLTGADGQSLRVIALLDPVMPEGSHVGQSLCRAEAGVTVTFTHWTEFDDSCTHLHIDFGGTDSPLLVG